MTTAVATPVTPVRLFPPDAAGGRARTLEDVVIAAVESRRLRGFAACLVCGERVEASGECRACGSELF